jgi:hypothetical protein
LNSHVRNLFAIATRVPAAISSIHIDTSSSSALLITTEAVHTRRGPGIPEPNQATVPAGNKRHELPTGHRAVKRAVLGGLHHEYSLVKEAA